MAGLCAAGYLQRHRWKWRKPMSRLKFFALVLVMLQLTGFVVAEDNLPPRVVRVVGTAEIKTVPDEAMIQLGVEKQSASAGTAKRLADDAARDVLADLRKNGVDEKDMQTTFLSLQ